MSRLLLAPFAALVLSATPALAQTPLGATNAPSELEQSGLTPPTTLSQGYSAEGEDTLVTALLGQTVWTSAGAGAEELGVISDMVVRSGEGISAVVLDVGGFLGLGEKSVAVDFAQMEWALIEDGSRRWVLPTNADALTAAPAFIWGESEAATGTPASTPEEEAEQLVEGDPNAVPVDPALTTDQPEAAPGAVPANRQGLTPFDQAGLVPEDVIGIGVYGVNDQPIGVISDAVANPDGSIDAVIVDVGGFLGLGAKPVAVGLDNLVFSADVGGNRYLFLNTTREQLEAQPQFDPATYAAERDVQRLVVTP